jgi:hypothetical protein
MTQKITFKKSEEAIEKLNGKELNAEGVKLGLKEIDDWLANPQTDHESDLIFRVKVVPFELSLNGEKRKIETIDFFCSANTGLDFFLTNALQDNNDFELQWNEEWTGKYIDFSENRLNSLVVFSNRLHNGKDKEEYGKNRQFWDIRDLEVDWENITLVKHGLSFDLSSPQSVSNFIYDKVYLSLSPYPSDEHEWIKKRLTEWKENKKPLVVENAVLRSWLSVKNSNILYVVGEKQIKGLVNEFSQESMLESKISGWEKLPYREKAKFLKRRPKEKIEDMKSEIEPPIRALENGDDNPGDILPPQNPNQNDPPKKEVPWKIIIPVSLFFLIVVVVGVIIVKKKK